MTKAGNLHSYEAGLPGNIDNLYFKKDTFSADQLMNVNPEQTMKQNGT